MNAKTKEDKIRRQNLSNLRKSITKLIESYQTAKTELSEDQRAHINEYIRKAKLILKNPKTPFYLDENQNIIISDSLRPRCINCNKDLEELRHPPTFHRPPKDAEKYCSKSCMVQLSKKEKMRKEFGADFINYGKNKKELIYILEHKKCQVKKPHHPIVIDLPTRKRKNNLYIEN